MIIFDLSTLANDSHRRHFIDPLDERNIDNAEMLSYNAYTGDLVKAIGWKPDWQAYYDAIDKDEPIWVTIFTLRSLMDYTDSDITIFSNNNNEFGIIKWLDKHDVYYENLILLKNEEPYYKLKEQWMFERCKIDDSFHPPGIKFNPGIEMAFDNDPDSIKMWKNNGIFCFDCRQDI